MFDILCARLQDYKNTDFTQSAHSRMEKAAMIENINGMTPWLTDTLKAYAPDMAQDWTLAFDPPSMEYTFIDPNSRTPRLHFKANAYALGFAYGFLKTLHTSLHKKSPEEIQAQKTCGNLPRYTYAIAVSGGRRDVITLNTKTSLEAYQLLLFQGQTRLSFAHDPRKSFQEGYERGLDNGADLNGCPLQWSLTPTLFTTILETPGIKSLLRGAIKREAFDRLIHSHAIFSPDVQILATAVKRTLPQMKSPGKVVPYVVVEDAGNAFISRGWDATSALVYRLLHMMANDEMERPKSKSVLRVEGLDSVLPKRLLC